MTKEKRVFLSFTVLLIVLPTAAALAQSSITNELQAALDEWRVSSEIAGAVLAIDVPGQGTMTCVSGVSDREAGTPLTPQDRFRIGSITKTFVAAMVLQLAQEGRLTLDDPLSAYVPDFPNAQHITIRHLLSHRSGIFDFEFIPGLVGQALQDPAKVWTWQEVVAAAADQEPYFAPGTGYHYSSTNFTLLGVVAEAVTGTRLSDELRRRFFDPFGLTNTFLGGAPHRPEGIIHGYGTLPDGTQFDIAEFPNTAFDTASWATGSMVSNAPDLVRWAQALYGGKGDVVDGDILDAMLTFEPSFGPAPSVLHGLGVFRYETPFGAALGHTGTWFGFSSRMMYFPELEVTVVVLVNQHFMDTSPIMEAAMKIITEASGIN
ncbi:serine hydrolase [candidate division KSB3 bacterium]|uniref:Serine hydrolase n=1 Tax=candidate division KSB3 bacterium TaxID=2044937 RepID=A0A9D5K140_9BACT|nr:serine hydrolase [candidate division KSB3 bacterium]MBD3327521.1 serine hydrolase [candidate division KSB3 bacterium]